MSRCLILSVGLIMFQVAVQAQSTGTNSTIVNYNAGFDIPNMVDAQDPTGIPNTSPIDGLTVEIGYFDLTSSQIDASASDLAFLHQNWHQFGPGTSITNLVFGQPAPGSFGSTIQQSEVFDPTAATFANKQIDLWVFRTSDGKTPVFDNNGNPVNVLEYGLYTRLSDNTWHFPVSGFPPGETSIDTSQVDKIFYGYEVQSGFNVISLGLLPVAVPEPSTLELFGFGLVFVRIVSQRIQRNPR